MARSLCLALCAASAAAWVLPAAPAARVARRRSVPAMTTEDAEWEAELSKRLESKARVSSDVHPVYCENVYRATRRKTRTVWAGQVPIGSEHRIARQTMTTTDTNDVEATVQQTIRCADAGADLVRITVQGRREAEACKAIRERLTELGYAHVALVADIHFQPKVALLVAEAFEKIRVNPGNFADGRKTFEEIDYDVWGGVRCFHAIDAFPSRGGRRRGESHASQGRYQHRTRSSSKMNEPTSRKRLRP